MLQTYPCVRLRCTDCGCLLIDVDEDEGRSHYATPDAALNAVRTLGGRVGRGGCVSCPGCGPTRLQTGLCIGVRCQGCTQALTTPVGYPAHYPTEATATAAARQAGWRATWGGEWFCPVCIPMLTCQAHGHAFTPWRLLRLAPAKQSGDQLVVRRGTLVATPLLRAYRSCQRCGAHQSHHDWLTSQTLIGGCLGQGKAAPTGWVISTGVPERGVA